MRPIHPIHSSAPALVRERALLLNIVHRVMLLIEKQMGLPVLPPFNTESAFLVGPPLLHFSLKFRSEWGPLDTPALTTLQRRRLADLLEKNVNPPGLLAEEAAEFSALSQIAGPPFQYALQWGDRMEPTPAGEIFPELETIYFNTHWLYGRGFDPLAGLPFKPDGEVDRLHPNCFAAALAAHEIAHAIHIGHFPGQYTFSFMAAKALSCWVDPERAPKEIQDAAYAFNSYSEGVAVYYEMQIAGTHSGVPPAAAMGAIFLAEVAKHVPNPFLATVRNPPTVEDLHNPTNPSDYLKRAGYSLEMR